MTTGSHRLTAVMYWATLASLVLWPLAIVAVVWFAPLSDPPLTMPDGYTPTDGRLRLGALASVPAALAMLWTLQRMHLLFRQFRQREVLTHRAARLIRQIGTGLLLVAVFRILAHPVQSLVLTLPAPVGSRMVSVNFSSSDLGFLLAAGLMVVIGWAMEDAARAADENRSFV